MIAKRIYITEFDRERLEGLLEQSRNSDLDGYLDSLRAELDRAEVVAPGEIPPDVITMNSTASLIPISTTKSLGSLPGASPASRPQGVPGPRREAPGRFDPARRGCSRLFG
jgi:hypothetical protein